MKKLTSILLAVALLVCTMSMGTFGVNASTSCTEHKYTNACDTTCNVCSAERETTEHDYNECYIGYEESIDYQGEWQIVPESTGVFLIVPTSNAGEFVYYSYHYILVTDKNGGEVKYSEKDNGWSMVKGQEYTIRVKSLIDDVILQDIDFELIKLIDKIFPDASMNAWYSDAVAYAVGAGIISGYSDGTFGPSDSIKRQDFLLMLARFDGACLSEYEDEQSGLSDVKDGAYYESAVNWGVKNKIVSGYDNGKFGVGDKVTREQLVTFIYRYAKHKELDVTTQLETKQYISATYPDYNKVSSFANEAIIWAIENDIINGKNGKIAPQGKAQRCEVAQIMYNNYLNDTIPGAKPCIHVYAPANCTTPKTCTLCGIAVGDIKHEFIDATCTRPIVCVACGETKGEPLGHYYILGECIRRIDGELCGHYSETYCPKLYFTGNMDNMTSKKDVRDITFEYRSKEQILTGAAKIKPQGTSSMAYDKKNFTINFYKDSAYAEKLGVNVGWGAQTEYCLKANWIDKTHSRNVVTAKLAGEMQSKYGLFETAPNNGAIDGFPIEVYINDQFHGLYTMNIPKDAWMFNMDTDNPNHIVICGENWNDPVKFKAIPQDLKDWSVEVGPEDDATLQKVQRLVDFVLNSSDEEFKANFDQYLNFDSTLNYYVMFNYAWLSDNTGKNMLLATYDGKVWYPSLYDLDTSWGTNWRGDGLYDYSKGMVNGGDSVLWTRFRTLFAKEIAERYFELRQDVLDTEHVMDEFRGFYESIPQEVLRRERQRWNTEETPIPGYEIPQIQQYLDSVVPRLDVYYRTWL